jgi:hypothetical protein
MLGGVFLELMNQGVRWITLGVELDLGWTVL